MTSHVDLSEGLDIWQDLESDGSDDPDCMTLNGRMCHLPVEVKAVNRMKYARLLTPDDFDQGQESMTCDLSVKEDSQNAFFEKRPHLLQVCQL